jgi:hypothetical protein
VMFSEPYMYCPTNLELEANHYARLALLEEGNSSHHLIFVINFGVSLTPGRAMAQAVSLRPLTAEARVRSRVSPCGICGGQSGTGTGFSSSTSIFPCQFHSTGAPLLGKIKKN